MLNLLMLGGTRFVGRTIVKAALARGHEVTLFNRGNQPDVFPELEHLAGDRDGKLGALKGRTWDAVVDTSGYVPRIVSQSLEALGDQVGHYTFISTLDVYESPDTVGIDESHPVKPLQDETIEDIQAAYGEMKARCEQLVNGSFPDRSLIVRCGLVAGPGDLSDRFTYWPSRIAAGGEVLAPGNPEAPIQFIDVRDLAEWTIRMIEAQETGTYNATGPASPASVGHVLQTCADTLGQDTRLTWVSDEFLLQHEIGSWIELPLWLPEEKKAQGLMRLKVDRALGTGLTYRPLADTIRDTYEWDQARGGWQAEPRKAGLSADKEQSLLNLWNSRNCL